MPKMTTLCYIRENGHVLMLYRNKKEQDENAGKWIGVGGKMKEKESPAMCMLREVREETGLALKDYRFRGIITFLSDCWDDEYMILYEGLSYEGSLLENCDEGELRWIPEAEVLKLSLWEGDRLFLKPLLEGRDLIFLRLAYQGDTLVSWEAEKGEGAEGLVPLREDLIAQVQEAQVKLGFAEETLHFYYPKETMEDMLGRPFSDAAASAAWLSENMRALSPENGERQLWFRGCGDRVEVTLNADAARWIRDAYPASDFLKELIRFFNEHHHGSIGEILDLFSAYGRAVCVTVDEETGFRYAVRFEDPRIDPHVYCIGMEMGHTIYHRFRPRDFERLLEAS